MRHDPDANVGRQYDIAVWAGRMPADDDEARRTFDAHWATRSYEFELPAEEIMGFVDDVTSRYPDGGELGSDAGSSPWADGEFTGNFSGSFLYFGLDDLAPAEALDYIADTAHRHGLVCFDPQENRVLVGIDGPPSAPA